ncbi:hypothetical protein VNI00_006249 [Paramarasmius palmivorus]|uniref:RNA methyltransferase n=1 Tax=Paramarasmius palmivorus TaxID=297713 RepID=A0AAW0D546_9AGAR
MTAQPFHGNYHGYYTKRPTESDARLTLLPKDIFKGKRVLDIGCNEGFVTIQIAQKYHPQKILGVDIDDTLIRAAWRKRAAVWSQQGPSVSSTVLNAAKESSNGNRKRKRHAESEPSTPDYSHFPLAFEHMFGPLPVPPSQNRGKHVFPHNVAFRTMDFVDGSSPELEEYDVVLAFSITKWIHLNNGDEGLVNFFRRVWDVLKPGGVFMLEPQGWDGYKKARRLIKTQHDLELRPGDFPRVLAEIGFSEVEHLGVGAANEEGNGILSSRSSS